MGRGWSVAGDRVGRGPALRLGLRTVQGLSESVARRIVAERERAAYRSVGDLARRVRLGEGGMVRLARADVFGSLEVPRREAVWDALADRSAPPLWGGMIGSQSVEWPGMSEFEEVVADYRAQGLSLRGHPLESLRESVERLGATTAVELGQVSHGRWAAVAGLVLLRQRPSSARGVTFVTLEDETGVANLIIKQKVWETYRKAARSATALMAFGTVQNQEGVIHLLVSRVTDLSKMLGGVAVPSRDFR